MNYWGAMVLLMLAATASPVTDLATSGSTFLIVSPLQTAARLEIFMVAVMPQTGQRHRTANGEAAPAQSQDASGCFIGALPLRVNILDHN